MHRKAAATSRGRGLFPPGARRLLGGGSSGGSSSSLYNEPVINPRHPYFRLLRLYLEAYLPRPGGLRGGLGAGGLSSGVGSGAAGGLVSAGAGGGGALGGLLGGGVLGGFGAGAGFPGGCLLAVVTILGSISYM